MSIRSAVLAGAAFSLLLAGAAAAAPAGHPDFSGVWGLPVPPNALVVVPGRSGSTTDPPVPYNAEYRKELDRNQAMIKAGKIDLGGMCMPPGVPMMLGSTGLFEFVDTPSKMLVIYEYQTQVRRLYMNARHPADPEPSVNGHSVAHWEGDVLVVDTVGIKDFTYLDWNLGPHSGETHVVERWRLLDKDTLKLDVTVEDKDAFTGPWSYTRTFKRRPGAELVEYECNENPRNPVNADGSMGFTFQGNDQP